MKLTLQHYLIVMMVALIGATAYLTYELNQEKTARRSLEASHNILEADFFNEQENISKAFDSIQKEIHIQNEYIADLLFDIDYLGRTKADIDTKSNENKDRIRAINNADSLALHISRRYH